LQILIIIDKNVDNVVFPREFHHDISGWLIKQGSLAWPIPSEIKEFLASSFTEFMIDDIYEKSYIIDKYTDPITSKQAVTIRIFYKSSRFCLNRKIALEIQNSLVKPALFNRFGLYEDHRKF